MKLYHYQLGLPKIKYPSGVLDLFLTRHAIKASQSDKYKIFSIPVKLDTSKATIIEVELSNDNRIEKILYRIEYDKEFDINLAIAFPTQKVKTCWLNKKTDTHKTLDITRYVRENT